MNPQLKELYKQTLLKHSKSPNNFGSLEDAAHATIRNPLCGDEVTVYVKITDTKIETISFVGQCCAICTASASIMTDMLANEELEKASNLTEKFIADFKEKPDTIKLPGDLAALSGVLEFPSRIRCATLPWEAVETCLKS